MTDEDRYDWRAVEKGLIPWSGAEYLEVVEFSESLKTTPKDDWDLRARRIGIESDEGVAVYQINNLMHENQIGFFVNKRYRESDETTRAAHLMRYFIMSRFLGRHKARFIAEGFIRPGEEPGMIAVNTNLFQALAEAPYSKTHGRGRMRKPTFDLAAIIARTKDLDREEEEREQRSSGHE